MVTLPTTSRFTTKYTGLVHWAIYHSDVHAAFNAIGFVETAFVNDLKCWRMCPGACGNASINRDYTACRAAFHSCGAANQVAFDPDEDSFHMLDAISPDGAYFKMFGVLFDIILAMYQAASLSVATGTWRLQALRRANSLRWIFPWII
ncbi:unnamed protein product [Prorocentrum cordatum]|uniref:Uncharacterized protein n=1 Tax=Prorocentrum cordatum TaxID=2364126 RepID=A0ABN9U831_9DINO|nr:unnamed protein product [Polarella glacialis]